MTDPYTFTVDPALLEEIRLLIVQLSVRSRYTTLTVPAAEFPAWCLALEREYFHTTTSKNGYRHCSSGIAHVVKTTTTEEYRMVSVTCDTPPAEWVTFPGGEGTRRWRFRATTPEVQPARESE